MILRLMRPIPAPTVRLTDATVMGEPNQIWLKAGSHPDDVLSRPSIAFLMNLGFGAQTDGPGGPGGFNLQQTLFGNMRPGGWQGRRFMHVDVCRGPIQTCDLQRGAKPTPPCPRNRRRGNADHMAPT